MSHTHTHTHKNTHTHKMDSFDREYKCIAASSLGASLAVYAYSMNWKYALTALVAGAGLGVAYKMVTAEKK